MTWFEALTGFREESPEQVRANIALEGPVMTSRVNGRVMTCGTLETPSLEELRARISALSPPPELPAITLREVIADIQAIHRDPSNAGSLVQVASQFNLLEMVSPSVTPEQGIAIYEQDRTQGPACAIAAGAGTIYRNYFVPLGGAIGQSATHQVDCLADLGDVLGNTGNRLWIMKNGYALATSEGLAEITARLRSASEEERDVLRSHLRVGIHWNTQVTLGDCSHTLTQVFCSALPVAYSSHPSRLWEPFARLVLEASYEALFCAAVMNAADRGSTRMYLTLLGGGAFGNDTGWIIDGIDRALTLFRAYLLDVALVSYGRSNSQVRELVERYGPSGA